MNIGSAFEPYPYKSQQDMDEQRRQMGDASMRPYLESYLAESVGNMTRGEVLALVDQYFPPSAPLSTGGERNSACAGHRELLELAAKAARMVGYEYSRSDQGGCECMAFDEGGSSSDYWNPLTDDGDALRLADALELDILHRVVGGNRVEILPAGGPLTVETYSRSGDRLAATRRAIVRAAAAIGKVKG